MFFVAALRFCWPTKPARRSRKSGNSVERAASEPTRWRRRSAKYRFRGANQRKSQQLKSTPFLGFAGSGAINVNAAHFIAWPPFGGGRGGSLSMGPSIGEPASNRSLATWKGRQQASNWPLYSRPQPGGSLPPPLPVARAAAVAAVEPSPTGQSHAPAITRQMAAAAVGCACVIYLTSGRNSILRARFSPRSRRLSAARLSAAC